MNIKDNHHLLTVWAIWKSRKKNSFNNQGVTPNESQTSLMDTITDLVEESWNAIRFVESRARDMPMHYSGPYRPINNSLTSTVKKA